MSSSPDWRQKGVHPKSVPVTLTYDERVEHHSHTIPKFRARKPSTTLLALFSCVLSEDNDDFIVVQWAFLLGMLSLFLVYGEILKEMIEYME